MLWQSQQDESPAAAAVGWARPSQNWARPKALQSPAFWVPACELSIKQLQSCLLRLALQSADLERVSTLLSIHYLPVAGPGAAPDALPQPTPTAGTPGTGLAACPRHGCQPARGAVILMLEGKIGPC